MLSRQSLTTLGLTTIGLLLLVFLGVRHYNGNVSALLHMDKPFGGLHRVPPGVVLYTDAAYDGMLYYQIARDIPELFSGQTPSLDSPYRFQRILLPLTAFMVTFNQERAFPYALLLINLLSAIAALALLLKLTKGKVLHALTGVINPAILVGILYSLTEPMSLLFVVVFLYAWEKNERKLNTVTLIALLLSLLARETTVFLIGPLGLWYLWKRQWKQAVLLGIPVALFAVWQYYLVLQLGSLPFRTGGNIIRFPLTGPIAVLKWSFEESGMKLLYRLSGVSLLAFNVALAGAVGYEWVRKRAKVGVICFLTTALAVIMLSMDPHMWGAITSIGRVVTPIYPVYALYAATRDTWVERTISVILLAVSIVSAIGIAVIPHPFVIS